MSSSRSSNSTSEMTPFPNFIAVPRAICTSCGSYSGPVLRMRDMNGLSTSTKDETLKRQVKMDLAYAKPMLRHLHEEMARLQTSMDGLIPQTTTLSTYVNEQEQILSPIVKLPPEILQRIFVLSCEEHDEHQNTISANSFSTLNAITQVSPCWREAAESFPRLWVNVNTAQMSQSFVRKSIILSNNLPINVHLANPNHPSQEQHIKMIAKTAFRWKALSTDGTFFPTVTRQISKNMTLHELNELKIKRITKSYEINETSGIDFSSATSLATLDIEHVMKPLRFLIHSNIPMLQITKFTSTSVHYETNDLRNILQGMPNIRNLQLNGSTYLSSAIILPSLETLELGGVEEDREWYQMEPDEDFGYLDDEENSLDYFTVPNLRQMRLKMNVDTKSFIQFIQRSGCSLTEFDCSCFPIHELCDFQDLKSVKTLHWTTKEFENLLYRGLTALSRTTKYDNGPLFPNLDTLNITIKCSRKVANNAKIDKYITRMIKSRIKPADRQPKLVNEFTSSLKTVNISLENGTRLMDMAELSRLIHSKTVTGNGIHISVMERSES